MRFPPVQITRRQALGSALLMTAVLPFPARAEQGRELLQWLEGNVVLLHDRHVPLPANLLRRLAANGARILDLTDDPVRLWRGEQASLLTRRDTRLLGVTRWPEFLMISGLAAESRRHVRHQQHDAASGTMTWLVA